MRSKSFPTKLIEAVVSIGFWPLETAAFQRPIYEDGESAVRSDAAWPLVILGIWTRDWQEFDHTVHTTNCWQCWSGRWLPSLQPTDNQFFTESVKNHNSELLVLYVSPGIDCCLGTSRCLDVAWRITTNMIKWPASQGRTSCSDSMGFPPCHPWRLEKSSTTIGSHWLSSASFRALCGLQLGWGSFE